MRYRTYPGTDISVSEVGFGVWTLAAGWWGDFTDEEAVALLHRAYDLGITFYDSADSYGNGRGDELLARAFADRRDRVTLATKVGYDFYNNADARRGQRCELADRIRKLLGTQHDERQQQDHDDLGAGHVEHAAQSRNWNAAPMAMKPPPRGPNHKGLHHVP